MEYCDIGYATDGVDIRQGFPDSSWIVNTSIHDCSNRGVLVKNTAGIELLRNRIERNTNYGIVLMKTQALVDSNLVRHNCDSTGLGTQLKITGPSNAETVVSRNFFGGNDTSYVKYGVVVELDGTGLGDSVEVCSNSFRYIEQVGLEITFRDVLMGGDSKSGIVAGRGTYGSEVDGNQFYEVGIVYDMYYAWNTVVKLTYAENFDLAIRSNDKRPIFGKVNPDTSLTGGYNFFYNFDGDHLWENPTTGFVVVTDAIPNETFFAQHCQWNRRSEEDLEENDPDLFAVDGTGLPNEIYLEECGTYVPMPPLPGQYWGTGNPAKALGTRNWPVQESEPEEGESFGIVSPNPMVQNAEVRFMLPSKTNHDKGATLTIFDLAGRLVRTIEIRPAEHTGTVSWDGRDLAGRNVGSGVYFARLEAGEFSVTQKVVVIR